MQVSDICPSLETLEIVETYSHNPHWILNNEKKKNKEIVMPLINFLVTHPVCTITEQDLSGGISGG